ncbi:MAG: four-carbon acid sugar kinase family protein [Candidatus Muiribacteriota bacterium]
MKFDLKEILFISDDLTGAGDCGVVLRKFNDEVFIYTTSKPEISKKLIIYDMETRHKNEKELDLTLRNYVSLFKENTLIFKKIDSTLRGNIKKEFEWLRNEFPETTFYFIPAFPEMNRITRGGRHYVDNILIEESEYVKTPVNPPIGSNLKNYSPDNDTVIHVDSELLPCLKSDDCEGKFITFDCENQTQLDLISKYIVKSIKKHKRCVIASAAGLLNPLQKNLKMKSLLNSQCLIPLQTLFFCGSMNSLNRELVRNLNFEIFNIDEGLLLEHEAYLDNMKININKSLIFGKNVAVFLRGEKIFSSKSELIDLKMATLFKKVQKLAPRVVITGGTTAYNCLKNINKFFYKVENIVSTGIPSLSSDGSFIIIKPGGFGENDFFLKITEKTEEK